jgi:hypothetical protein
MSPATKARKKSKWKITDEKGTVFIAEGTSVTTEEGTFTVHVYDGNECILIVQTGMRVEVLDDPRLQVMPKKRARRTKK